MHAEHERIDALLAPQLEAWQALVEAPSGLAERAPRLALLARELGELFEQHLDSEEQHIFPALRTQLDHAELAAIEQEIRERRRNQYQP